MYENQNVIGVYLSVIILGVILMAVVYYFSPVRKTTNPIDEPEVIVGSELPSYDKAEAIAPVAAVIALGSVFLVVVLYIVPVVVFVFIAAIIPAETKHDPLPKSDRHTVK